MEQQTVSLASPTNITGALMILEPEQIGSTFLSARRPPPPSNLSPVELGRRIGAEHAAARAKWNGVVVDINDFARALGLRCADQATLFERAPLLTHAADVYLAIACESGDEVALVALDPVLVRETAKAAARVRGGTAFADEVAQAVRERLFLGGADGRPRIGDYDGAGALASWIRVMAARLALNLTRGAGDRRSVDDASAVLAAIPAPDDPELEYAKTRHAREFREALVEALRGLPDEQRALLKFYYIDRQTTTELGRIFAVNHSTIIRRLAEARERLVAGAHQALKARLHLDDEQLRSLARLVRSRIGESFLVTR